MTHYSVPKQGLSNKAIFTNLMNVTALLVSIDVLLLKLLCTYSAITKIAEFIVLTFDLMYTCNHLANNSYQTGYSMYLQIANPTSAGQYDNITYISNHQYNLLSSKQERYDNIARYIIRKFAIL